jgi:uncharacterized protein
MKLPRELIDALKIKKIGDTVAYLATSGLDGKPNLAVQQFTDVLDDEFVLMPDLFAQKTKVNLNENLVGTLTIAWPSELSGWVVEGPCNIFQWGHPPNYSFQGLKAGPILSGWGEWDQKESPDTLPEDIRPTVFAQRGVIVLKAEKVSRIGGDL